LINYDRYGEKKLLKNGIYKVCDQTERYQYCIIFDNGVKIFQKNSLIKEGIEKKINNISVITMGSKEGMLEYNMKFRTEPNAKSKIIPFPVIDEKREGMTKNIDFIPKGYVIKIIARTKEKYKINDWNNYWYFVSVDDTFGNKTIKGWMFSEFIKIIK
jgi:hypothetical protein